MLQSVGPRRVKCAGFRTAGKRFRPNGSGLVTQRCAISVVEICLLVSFVVSGWVSPVACCCSTEAFDCHMLAAASLVVLAAADCFAGGQLWRPAGRWGGKALACLPAAGLVHSRDRDRQANLSVLPLRRLRRRSWPANPRPKAKTITPPPTNSPRRSRQTNRADWLSWPSSCELRHGQRHHDQHGHHHRQRCRRQQTTDQ